MVILKFVIYSETVPQILKSQTEKAATEIHKCRFTIACTNTADAVKQILCPNFLLDP